VEKKSDYHYYIDMQQNKPVIVIKTFIFLCVLCVLCGLNFSANDPMQLSSVRYWAYQIQGLDASGAVQKIVDSKYDMIVIDPTVTYDPEFNAADMVAKIKASKASDGVHRKLVIAYIDIGQAEEWRWYWDGHTTYEENGLCKNSYVQAIQSWAPFVVACDPDGWAGNYPVAFWDEDWKDIVINGTGFGSHLNLYFDSMLDEVIQDGFDGVYLDWVEAWEMEAVQDRAADEGKDPGQEMLKFIKEMRTYGKQYNSGFIVIQQNSSELIDEVGAAQIKTAVDAIAQEGVWWDGVGGNDDWDDSEGYDYASCCTNYYLTRLRKYKAAGLPVFVCDYALSKSSQVYQKSAAEGFIGYATRRSLSRLTTTPPTFSTIGETDPFGSFDTPLEGATVRSSVAVTGWALDNTGISHVKIYRESENGGTLKYIGDAIRVEGARPDVQQLYPGYPQNSKAGWGYMLLTNFLPNNGNGTFVLHAVATDTSGNSTTLGTKTITCDNINAVKPFGAIDTPTQGGTASGGSFVNWGWVLTPEPNRIPTNGATIDVWVDGVKIGHPAYNIYRSDIAALFPGYANSNGAVGYFYLDTTAYDNGVHTIQWTAMDNVGNSDGIGSRYFTIQNNNRARLKGSKFQGSMVVGSKVDDDVSQLPADIGSPVMVKTGFNEAAEFRYVYPDERGILSIQIKHMECLEIHLSSGALHPYQSTIQPSNHPTIPLSPLPIGATLDSEGNVLYWQPGPGFLGFHRLEFAVYRESVGMIKKVIRIKIIP
jgi:uncharacterized protein (TIGR01370 family)